MHIYVKSPSLSAYFHTKSPSLSDFFKKYLFICKKSSTFARKFQNIDAYGND